MRHSVTGPGGLAPLDPSGPGSARVDLAGLAVGKRPDFGEPVAGPLLLVCTHRRRNVCCARLGRPLAAALTRLHGAAVLETTHVGGDRHAANLVILPHGCTTGRWTRRPLMLRSTLTAAARSSLTGSAAVPDSRSGHRRPTIRSGHGPGCAASTRSRQARPPAEPLSDPRCADEAAQPERQCGSPDAEQELPQPARPPASRGNSGHGRPGGEQADNRDDHRGKQ